ncbi:hypothetical protein [Tenacibaculum sp. 190524A05c]|uniref:hypothetical protein n=1 Tax=Tenacibaculum platacis TaxID=3137852 RepID=UPI0032B2E8EE
MKKNILNFGKALNKIEQKTINGGGRAIPCFEWCALDSYFQSTIPKPLFCNCNTNTSGGSNNTSGGNNNGPVDPV